MSGPQRLQDRGAELQQAQLVGHGGLALADARCRLLLAQPIAADELGQACGLFQIVQVLALEILHQGDEAGLGVVQDQQDAGDAAQSGKLGRPEPPLPGDKLIAVGPAPDRQRLQYAVLADARSQLLQGGLVKNPPGLRRIGPQLIHRQKNDTPRLQQCFCFWFCHTGSSCFHKLIPF